MIAAIAVLWVGTGLRLWTTWYTPPTHNVYLTNRYYFTTGVVLVAGSFSIRTLGVEFDEYFGVPNLGDLLWHLLLIMAGAFVFLYSRGQRTGELIRQPVFAPSTLISVAACLALIGFWWLSAVHDRYTPDLLSGGPPFSWVLILYVLLFQAHFVAWIGRIAIRSLEGCSQANRAGRQARVVRRLRIAQSQGVMAIGSLFAVAGAAVTAFRALDFHLTSADELNLHQVNSALSYVAAFLISVGFGIPVLVNLHSAFRDVRTLRPLWRALTQRCAHLDFGTVQSSVRLPPFALTITTYRRDIGDALSRIHVALPSATEVVRSSDPEAALGQVLAHADQWTLAAHSDSDCATRPAVRSAAASEHPSGAVARDLLEFPSQRPELEQLLRISAAFNSMPRSTVA